jgi:hypothetical protein
MKQEVEQARKNKTSLFAQQPVIPWRLIYTSLQRCSY